MSDKKPYWFRNNPNAVDRPPTKAARRAGQRGRIAKKRVLDVLDELKRRQGKSPESK